MLTLITTIIVGLGIAYFATQNTNMVSMTLFNTQLGNVPLYMIIIGSMLFGLVAAWLISLFSSVSSFFTIKGKEGTIRSAKREVTQLKERLHELEVENARLQGIDEVTPTRSEIIAEEHKPNIFSRFGHRFA